MNAGMKITLISCIAAGVLTVSVPLLSEATNRGRGHAVMPPEVILLPQENAVTDGTDEMPAGTPTEPESPVTEPLPEEDITVRVLDADTGKITEMALDGYITCVVAAEMPYTFNSEALKAQAVAARSFCLYRMKNEDSKRKKAGITPVGEKKVRNGVAPRDNAAHIPLRSGPSIGTED